MLEVALKRDTFPQVGATRATALETAPRMKRWVLPGDESPISAGAILLYNELVSATEAE